MWVNHTSWNTCIVGHSHLFVYHEGKMPDSHMSVLNVKTLQPVLGFLLEQLTNNVDHIQESYVHILC